MTMQETSRLFQWLQLCNPKSPLVHHSCFPPASDWFALPTYPTLGTMPFAVFRRCAGTQGRATLGASQALLGGFQKCNKFYNLSKAIFRKQSALMQSFLAIFLPQFFYAHYTSLFFLLSVRRTVVFTDASLITSERRASCGEASGAKLCSTRLRKCKHPVKYKANQAKKQQHEKTTSE